MTGPEEEERSILAAEYVIGLLPLLDRKRVERQMTRDPALMQEVAFWQEHLSRLNSLYGSETAPAHIKAAIDRRLFASNRRWMGWGLGTLVAAIILVMVALPFGLGRNAELVATLASDGSDYTFAVVADADTQELSVRISSGDLPDARTFELWLLPTAGAPRSLGTFDTTAQIVPPADLTLAEGTTLAISIEPTGGSPTGAPTGPVVAVGGLRDG
jgi:anti-sigma-K factor RskA